MPVSGLVVTLELPGYAPGSTPGSTPGTSPGSPVRSAGNDPDVVTPAPGDAAVIEQIQQHPNFQAGPRQDQRLPVVLDTPDKETDKQCWGWINQLPGVHHVDVAFIHFEDEEAFEPSPCSTHAQQPIAAPTIGET